MAVQPLFKKIFQLTLIQASRINTSTGRPCGRPAQNARHPSPSAGSRQDCFTHVGGHGVRGKGRPCTRGRLPPLSHPCQPVCAKLPQQQCLLPAGDGPA